MSFVYFIRAGRTNAIKIGWTTNPEKRLRHLQTSSPYRLHLIGFLPGSRADEADWHAQFADDHTHGEWFTLSAALRQAINDLSLQRPDFENLIALSAVRRVNTALADAQPQGGDA